MQKNSKLSFILFVIICFILILYSIFAIYLHDPLQIWHKPFFRHEITYSKEIRESAKAMIRNEQFDSIIIGDSRSENISCKSAEKIFGGKFINLSISGSTLYEKNLILTYILKRKKIKKVIFILDDFSVDLLVEPRMYNTKQYSFLYNDNLYDDYKIYLYDKYFYKTILLNNSKECIGEVLNMDRPFAWDEIPDFIDRFGGFENWIKCKDNEQIIDYFKLILSTPQSINTNPLTNHYKERLAVFFNSYFFSNVSKERNTQFYLIISPVNELELARRIRAKNQFLAKQNEILTYLVNIGLQYENLKIFAFNNDPNLINIKDYKDGTHYTTSISLYILESLNSNKYVINFSNLKKYIDDVNNIAVNFDYEYYYNQIKEAVK